MWIEKGASHQESYKDSLKYYENARAAMFDLLQVLYKEGMITKVLLPGYIGWSPREGSGIFDPINSIEGLDRQYYKMKDCLCIDETDLFEKVTDSKTVVLIVNYFGFRDDNLEEIIIQLKKKGVLVIEDNAHGLYTYFKHGRAGADATFFSLHKMLPFEKGGALLLLNEKLKKMTYSQTECDFSCLFDYDLGEIARKRTCNYTLLDKLVRNEECKKFFVPLKAEGAEYKSVPQTYPILIRKGNRDRIYEIMNNQGFGVVSLYHTLIPELRGTGYEESQKISKTIMNLPVHQDADATYYPKLLESLISACEETAVC